MLTRDNGTRYFSVSNAINFGVNEAVFIQYLMDELNSAYLLRQNGKGRVEFDIGG